LSKTLGTGAVNSLLFAHKWRTFA